MAFKISDWGKVRYEVIDSITGEVKLAEEEVESPGYHFRAFDGVGRSGTLPDGTYRLRIVVRSLFGDRGIDPPDTAILYVKVYQSESHHVISPGVTGAAFFHDIEYSVTRVIDNTTAGEVLTKVTLHRGYTPYHYYWATTLSDREELMLSPFLSSNDSVLIFSIPDSVVIIETPLLYYDHYMNMKNNPCGEFPAISPLYKENLTDNKSREYKLGLWGKIVFTDIEKIDSAIYIVYGGIFSRKTFFGLVRFNNATFDILRKWEFESKLYPPELAIAGGNLYLALKKGKDVILYHIPDWDSTHRALVDIGLHSDNFKVYDKNSNGYVPGEGSGFIVLERLNKVISEGRKIYGIIREVQTFGVPTFPATNRYTDNPLINLFSNANKDSMSPEVIYATGSGVKQKDYTELQALERFFPDVPVTTFTEYTGVIPGCSGIINTVLWSYSNGKKVVFNLLNTTSPISESLVLKELLERDISKALVTEISEGGMAGYIYLTKDYGRESCFPCSGGTYLLQETCDFP